MTPSGRGGSQRGKEVGQRRGGREAKEKEPGGEGGGGGLYLEGGADRATSHPSSFVPGVN